jgi:hypothetical protein
VSLIGLKQVNVAWKSQIEECGFGPCIIYEPFSEYYWNSKIKIALCNLEAYDITGIIKNSYKMDLKVFEGWLDKKWSRTPKFSAVFINALLLYLCDEVDIDMEKMRELYKNRDNLIDSINNIAYFNINICIGKNIKYNKKISRNIINQEWYLKYLSNYLQELDYDILCITGKDSVDIVSALLSIDLEYNRMVLLNNKLIVSLTHFRNFKYDYALNKIYEIGKHYYLEDRRTTAST